MQQLPSNMVRSLRLHVRAMMGMLAATFVLGMISNLYVEFPETTDQNELWKAASAHWPVLLHMILGIGIVLTGIMMLIRARKAGQRSWVMMNLLGFFFLLVAAFGGQYFVSKQEEIYSLLMAFGYLGASVAYGYFMSAVDRAVTTSA